MKPCGRFDDRHTRGGKDMEEKPNASIVEMYSINKLTDAVLRTGVIEPDIHKNDRTPSWDGEMRLYHSSEFNNPI